MNEFPTRTVRFLTASTSCLAVKSNRLTFSRKHRLLKEGITKMDKRQQSQLWLAACFRRCFYQGARNTSGKNTELHKSVSIATLTSARLKQQELSDAGMTQQITQGYTTAFNHQLLQHWFGVRKFWLRVREQLRQLHDDARPVRSWH